MYDRFKDFRPSLSSPPSNAFEIVPDDVAELSTATRALYVGGSGDIVLRLVSGDMVTLKDVHGGVIYPLRVAQVYSSTTATGLVGLS